MTPQECIILRSKFEHQVKTKKDFFETYEPEDAQYFIDNCEYNQTK